MLALVLVAAGLIGYDTLRPERSTSPFGGDPVPPGPAPSETAVVPVGAGTFTFATGAGPVVGSGGPVQTYRVAVEDGAGLEAEAFAESVEAVLSDARSWIADGSLRLRRVPGEAAATFTVYLATPVTSEQLCAVDYLQTEQFTNCRLGDDRVVINSARWLTGVPDYGAALDVYRAYAINHEVGHQLGHGHEACPAAGAVAPVMAQQTLGLQGCVANGWPFVAGVRYSGPPVI